MSLSRRDHWLGIYGYSDTGVEGVVRDTWTLSGSWWGRVDDYTGRQQSRGGSNEVQVDSVIQVADEAVVPVNAIVIDGTSLVAPMAYQVKYTVPKQTHTLVLLYAVRIDRLVIDPTALLLNGMFVLDGSEILNGVAA